MHLMQRLARWHIWLGWIVALPILLWLVSGLVMSFKPLEETRGEHLCGMDRHWRGQVRPPL